MCGCTAETPCTLYTGEECGWLNKRMNVCNGRTCVMEYDRRVRAAKAEKSQKKPDPYKVLERKRGKDGRLHATRIVKRRPGKSKGRAA